jgi:hypothetical protein
VLTPKYSQGKERHLFARGRVKFPPQHAEQLGHITE